MMMMMTQEIQETQETQETHADDDTDDDNDDDDPGDPGDPCNRYSDHKWMHRLNVAYLSLRSEMACRNFRWTPMFRPA